MREPGEKVHEATGLKVQFNLFYRTDFFYVMDEFTLADMPDTYKAEFQANSRTIWPTSPSTWRRKCCARRR